MTVDFNEALQIVLSHVRELPNDNITIAKSIGRTLKENIIAEINIPPFTNSAMDGFCVRCVDVQKATPQNPVKLKIVDDIPAGASSDTVLGVKQAIRIMTGAPIPLGADAVARVEDTRENGDEVEVFKSAQSEENIRPVGEDIPIGTVVLTSGKNITPADLGVLASLGQMYIRVSEQPRVAVLATGDELVCIDEPLCKGKIRSSNSYSIMGLISLYGGRPWNLEKVADDKSQTKTKLWGAQNADIILTIGGVSVGKYDLVKETFRELGVEEKFWKVRMKPGMPVYFGVWGGKLVFGLPGNPVSCMICFEQLVLPAINKMLGRKRYTLPVVQARLKHELAKKADVRHFFRSRLIFGEAGPEVFPLSQQGSGMLHTMSMANSLIVGKEGVELLAKDEMVDVQIRDFSEWC